eukprot:scaffold39636_cov573-Isochrysis_galbana.AAC.1
MAGPAPLSMFPRRFQPAWAILWLPQPCARRAQQDRSAEPYSTRRPWFPARDDEFIPRWHGGAG